ncbi:MAG: hypothetical protein R6U41_04585 [Desulfosalsimonas sp.]|uniref:hypothetical protein n=1 Tax=Desulfosalsimonas sp. TaxID=3073848 RepID=UPI003970C697
MANTDPARQTGTQARISAGRRMVKLHGQHDKGKKQGKAEHGKHRVLHVRHHFRVSAKGKFVAGRPVDLFKGFLQPGDPACQVAAGHFFSTAQDCFPLPARTGKTACEDRLQPALPP